MLAMKDRLHSGGPFVDVTAPHRGSRDSHLIKVRVDVCTPEVLWIIFLALEFY